MAPDSTGSEAVQDSPEVSEDPSDGPLAVDTVYKRRELHQRFGGNRQAGIVPSSQEPVVLLFHTDEPAHQFYGDGWDEDGLYWYSGEGLSGGMRWTAANKAVRDHAADNRSLLLFERVQRQDGLWRFAGEMRYVAHKYETRPDKNDRPRRAIVFALL